MKKIFLTLAITLLSLPSFSMSYEQAREHALFLTDKMAYELDLTEEQYEAAYEVNLDYLMSVNTADEVYSEYWRRRNLDISYILFNWQYTRFCSIEYFYRPLYWYDGFWRFRIFAHYPHRTFFYFGRPGCYVTYRGGHSWHMNGGHSWYHGKTYKHHEYGMRGGWDRGGYRDMRSGWRANDGGHRGINHHAPQNSNHRGDGYRYNDRGNNSRGDGYRDNDRGNSSRGDGYRDNDRGNSSRGNGYRDNNRGNSSRGDGYRKSSTRETVGETRSENKNHYVPSRNFSSSESPARRGFTEGTRKVNTPARGFGNTSSTRINETTGSSSSRGFNNSYSSSSRGSGTRSISSGASRSFNGSSSRSGSGASRSFSGSSSRSGSGSSHSSSQQSGHFGGGHR